MLAKWALGISVSPAPRKLVQTKCDFSHLEWPAQGQEEESCARVDSNEEQIIGILKESEAGVATPELCRKHGIASQTLYRWKGKYGGMEVSEAKRLRTLEEENRQLKHMVAEMLLDKRALQAVVAKKW
jgi:putative transposase